MSVTAQQQIDSVAQLLRSKIADARRQLATYTRLRQDPPVYLASDLHMDEEYLKYLESA